MVTSTPWILLLPMLIYLQHCIDVHGKSETCRVRLCARPCIFVCVRNQNAEKHTVVANITEQYTCLGCALKEWPCLATHWVSKPWSSIFFLYIQTYAIMCLGEKRNIGVFGRMRRVFVVLEWMLGINWEAQCLFLEGRDGEARVVYVAWRTATACRCSFMVN